ncbi:MAG: septal ring lytic transglycosylase RlpA family protein [Caldimonas sp.]
MRISLPSTSSRWLCAAAALALVGCGSLAPQSGMPLPGRGAGPVADASRDAPKPPRDLDRVADAAPRLEPVPPGGPNKPYRALGRDYVPIGEDRPFSERGLASWYGRPFHGRRTASGEVYDMYAMSAAHPTLPIPSYARVRNPSNGREVVVRINDRGPFHPGRIIDLSFTAASKLDVLRGVAPVEVERITFDEIRAGTWSRDRAAGSATVPAESEPKAAGTAGTLVATTDVALVVASAGFAEPNPAPAVPASDSKPIAHAPPARAYTKPARGFWVQLGAFRHRDGAASLQRSVTAQAGGLTPLLTVFGDQALYRLQAGPYPSRDEARSAAEDMRDALKIVPVIVERR